MLKLEECLIDEELNINSYNVKEENITVENFTNKYSQTKEPVGGELRSGKYLPYDVMGEKIENANKDVKDIVIDVSCNGGGDASAAEFISNENYVNKAPANIVEMDRQKLALEKEKLESLLS